MPGNASRVPACLRTEGSAPDYVVLYGGAPAHALEGGGFADEGYVDAEVRNDERTRVRVSYDATEGLQGVSAFDPDAPDDETVYEPAENQPEHGTHWIPEDDDREQIKIVPETEVPA